MGYYPFHCQRISKLFKEGWLTPNSLIHGEGFGIGKGGKSCLDATWLLIFEPKTKGTDSYAKVGLLFFSSYGYLFLIPNISVSNTNALSNVT